ncbi:MAG: hypothetical protein LBE56_09170 [Tannerella sp.]|jgi:hypothetical protein|nr:hypothetical protein [Tannerella sp.]
MMTMLIHAQQSSGDTNYSRYAGSQKKYTFTVQPLYLLSGGLKFDFEMRLGNGPGWLQFSPSVYYRDGNMNNNEYIYYGQTLHYTDWHPYWIHEPFSKLRGAGLDVNYKRFINVRRDFYTAAGLTYAHYNIKYWGFDGYEFIEDGLPYYGYKLGNQTQSINRLGANWYFGFRIPTRNAFVLDMFWGLGYRHSFSERDKPQYDDNFLTYGWTGFSFLAGMKIGFGIK